MSVRYKIRNFLYRAINKVIKNKSSWYNDQLFCGCRKFWNQKDFNLDIVNTGSTSGYYAFDYSGLNMIKAANWALPPQSLLLDYEILQNYSSFLRKGAIVLISLCPFTCLVGYDIYVRDRYYTLLRHNSIPEFHYKRLLEIEDRRQHPLKYYPLVQIIPDACKLFHIHFKKKVMNDAELTKNANQWLSAWMKEFSIKDFNRELSLKNKDSYHDSVEILSSYIEYCLCKNLKPILVVPPVSKQLASLFTGPMRKLLFDDYFKLANRANIPVYNYFDSEISKNRYMFRDAFLLNAKGSETFTKQLLEDLNVLNEREHSATI